LREYEWLVIRALWIRESLSARNRWEPAFAPNVCERYNFGHAGAQYLFICVRRGGLKDLIQTRAHSAPIIKHPVEKTTVTWGAITPKTQTPRGENQSTGFI